MDQIDIIKSLLTTIRQVEYMQNLLKEEEVKKAAGLNQMIWSDLYFALCEAVGQNPFGDVVSDCLKIYLKQKPFIFDGDYDESERLDADEFLELIKLYKAPKTESLN